MFHQPGRQVQPNRPKMRPRIKMLWRKRIRHLLLLEFHLTIRSYRDEFKREEGPLLRHTRAETHGGLDNGVEIFDHADLLLYRLGGFDERAEDVVADQLHGALAPVGAESLIEDAGAVAAPFVELGDVFLVGFIFCSCISYEDENNLGLDNSPGVSLCFMRRYPVCNL